MSTWECQEQIDLLVKSGFAEVDEGQTIFWTTYNADQHVNFCVPMYRWTAAGQEACPRYRHSTPMSWAEVIGKGKERHCIGCGRDTRGQKVWSKYGANRTVCMACAPAYEAGKIRLKVC